MERWLNDIVLVAQGHPITVRGLLGCLFGAIICIALLRLARIFLAGYTVRHKLAASSNQAVKRYLGLATIALFLIISALSLSYNPEYWSISMVDVMSIILIISLASIADVVIAQRIMEEFDNQTHKDIYQDQYGEKNKSQITKLVRRAMIFGVSAILLVRTGWDFGIPLGEKLGELTVSKMLWIFCAFFITRLMIWVIVNLVLYGWYKKEKIDIGKQYAYNQLLSYVIYFMAMLVTLHFAGINLTVAWAGAAALLVGVGIALQQVISDFFSGIVILFERSIEVGDFLNFGSEQGTVKKIGIRASVIETLENKNIIVPNSKLVNDQVTNASNNTRPTRFDVSIGVAYGSDMDLVRKLMLQAAYEQNAIRKTPTPFVRLNQFGESSLDCNIYFFTNNIRFVNDIKSDIRLRINELFIEHDVSIPFPQRDVHMHGG